jgi:hypothetical protein
MADFVTALDATHHVRGMATLERGTNMPALSLSLLLIAVGAILAFAVNVSVSGVSLYAVGIILLIVGIVGALMSALFWTSFAPFARRDRGADVHV